MFAKVICHPPLGQVAIVPSDAKCVTFNVLIESSHCSQGERWEVAIWHNHRFHDQWEALTLEEMSDHSSMLFVSHKSRPAKTRRWFSAELVGKAEGLRPVSFTVKFRRRPNEGWKWVGDEFAAKDGNLYYQRTAVGEQDISTYIDNIDSTLDIRKEASDCPDTVLWSITFPVKAAVGPESGWTARKLGTPSNFTRWFALVRIWSPWLAPRHGQRKFSPDKDAVLAAFLRHDGINVVVIAVSGVSNVLTVLNHDGDGNVTICGRNDNEQEGVSRIIVAAGKTFELAVAAAMYHARKIVTSYGIRNKEQEAEVKALLSGVKPEWLENWYDGFTYCTWNGLGQNLTEEKINGALDSLQRANIHITNLIIDDNWQSLDNEGKGQMERGWLEFEANEKAFPRGLKKTITDVRQKHSSIAHIAVWHALLGYWGGISPNGAIAKEYKTVRVRSNNAQLPNGSMLVVDAEDAQRYYNDFYKFLDECGIDSVKTDAQFMLDELEDANDRKRLIQKYQDVWMVNSLRYFSIKAISCMSQVPQILFHTLLPINKPRFMARNSDDFFPEVPESHPWHVFCNAHNSLFTQHLNILPDWDMFQTSHPWASFHAAARCVSGGPIYFTDEPGKHDLNLIYQMTAATPRGNTVILRPHTMGKATQAYVGYDEQTLLKVGTFVGMQRTGAGILGIFNVGQKALTEMISLAEFPGTDIGEYIIRDHSSGIVTKPMAREDKAPLVGVSLGIQGWRIMAAYPLRTFELKSRKTQPLIKFANLGLIGKMTGAAAIVGTNEYVEETGRLRIWTALKALGILGIYVSDLPNMSLEDEVMVLLFGKAIPFDTVRRNRSDEHVLEVDVERAWKESDQKAGWSNEVNVEIFIR